MFQPFESIFPSLEPLLVKVDQHRKKAKRNLLIAILISGLIAVLFLYLNFILFFFFLPALLIIDLSVYAIINYKFKQVYANHLVEKLIKELFQNLTPTEGVENAKYHASYNPKGHIAQNELDQSNLNGGYNSMTGEDYIEGQLGLTTFKFSEIGLVNTGTHPDDDSTTIFEGVVFICDFHKAFEGNAYILKRNFSNRSKLNRDRDAFNIELTDTEFNKAFIVKTTDDVEARYILSSNFARKILDYSNRCNAKVEFAFVDSKMFIFRSSNEDHFSGKLFNRNDKEVLKQIYDDFLEYFSIVDELNLNRRIWSKV